MALNAHSHDTGQAWMTTWTPAKVVAAPDQARAFALYAQQVSGTPWATVKDLVVLRQRISDVFDHYPQANYYTLCRLVEWTHRKKIRVGRVYLLIDRFREAWVDHALPELDLPAPDRFVEQRMADALRVESDPSWRRRLIGAVGAPSRNRVLAEWMDARGRQ